MVDGPREPRAAYLEDFNEDDQTELPHTRQTASTANTTAKRSKADPTILRAVRDEFSDSGYSSHTTATLGSGHSLSRPDQSSTKPTTSSVDSSTTVKKVEPINPGRPRSPVKVAAPKVQSRARERSKHCDCHKCLTRTSSTTAKATTSSSSSRIHDTQRQKPVQPFEIPQRRPRAFSTQQLQRPRPMSFHAGMMGDGLYQQVFVDPAPPPQFAAVPPFIAQSYPSMAPILPAQPLPPQPQTIYTPIMTTFEPNPRVTPRPWPIERRRTARPQSMYHEASPLTYDYAHPIYEDYENEKPYVPTQQTSTRRRGRAQQDEDYQLMPPPPPRAPSRPRDYPEQRPLIRHAATTSAVAHFHPSGKDRGRDAAGDLRSSRPSSRKPSFDDSSRLRRPSLSRQPRTSDEKVAFALQAERYAARSSVDPETSAVRSRRRASVYEDESLRGKTEGLVEKAEAHQASMGNMPGNSASTPNHEDMLRLTRKKPHTASSDGGSRLSGRSKASRDGASDTKSARRSSGGESKHRDNGDQGLEMRIPKGFNVNFKPSLEGHTISVKASEDGDGDMQVRFREKDRQGTPRSTTREKSRRRTSFVEGRVNSEADLSASRMMEHLSLAEEDEPRPLMVRERYLTRTRSRRESRLPEDGGFF